MTDMFFIKFHDFDNKAHKHSKMMNEHDLDVFLNENDEQSLFIIDSIKEIGV